METKAIDDGGPAFPNEEIAMVRQGWPGMSLRAYFAGQAMQGLAPKYIAEKHEGYCSGYFAREAVEIADALLAALNGGA